MTSSSNSAGRSERRYAVWLGDLQVGTIHQRGDYTRFSLADAYRDYKSRPVLGLTFEEDLHKVHSAALRLPPWFSNLLPEGRLRDWIADDRGVSADREMELLAQVGHDLPGAVRVFHEGTSPVDLPWEASTDQSRGTELVSMDDHPGWRFSLAGVQLKFSMLSRQDRLTLPAFGEGGDWIVKLPDREYPDVPSNEFAMMSLAKAAGVEVPELKLVHRDLIDGLPDDVWPRSEQWAFAIRRFDRDGDRRLIHIEDLAQVCNVYSDRKYAGNYESVGSMVYRNHDVDALREFARRLAFIILISNGDAHLKNWSLIYRNPRVPTLSPAYDLVSTAAYRGNRGPEDLGLKFGGTKQLDRISTATFGRLERRLGATDAYLADVVLEIVRRTTELWPRYADILGKNPTLQNAVESSITMRAASLLRAVG